MPPDHQKQTADETRSPEHSSSSGSLRVGPVVFVPEFRTHDGYDPWAHRKGEPRILALLWAVYLMLGAMITIFSVRSIGIATNAQYRFGCIAMCIVAGVGVALLWPMVRLSQRAPIRPTRAALQDFLALLIPLQAVVWPMPLLTGWPLGVIGAIMLSLLSWGLLSCAVVAWGSASVSGITRTLWTGTLIILVGIAPIVWMLNAGLPGPPMPGWWEVLSPLTAPAAIVAAPGNLNPRVHAVEWLALTIPGLAGLMLLVATRWRPSTIDDAYRDPRLPSGTEAPPPVSSRHPY